MVKSVAEVKNVVKFIKRCGRITSAWPVDSDATRNAKIFGELLWWVSFGNTLSLAVPLMLGLYHYRCEITVLMKTMAELTALSEAFFNLIICKFQRRRFQSLLTKITEDVMNADVEDELVYQKYVNRYFNTFVSVGSLFFLAAVTFSCGPLVMDTELPADAWYPFSIDLPLVRYSVYLTQVLAILQTGISVTVDITVGMMLWYTSASIEILAKRMGRVMDESDMSKCIIEHQRIIDFARETNYAVRYLILKSNGSMTLAAICGAFPLIYHQPVLVILQFILLVFCGLFKLYLSAWPADDMAEMSNKLGDSVYSMRWVDGSVRMRSSVLFAVQRSQTPLVISVSGIIPALTLTFYASFVSGTISYFVTLRAVFG